MNSSEFSALHRSRILPIANAVFIEESDLVLFLVVHPSPTQFLTQLAAGARHHLIYLNGCWECCLSGSLGASWLSQATPSINAQLEHGQAIHGTRLRESQTCTPDSFFTDYLGYLMDPYLCRPVVAATLFAPTGCDSMPELSRSFTWRCSEMPSWCRFTG